MNVEIRAIKPSDTNNIVKWRNSKHVLEYFIDRAKITPEYNAPQSQDIESRFLS